MTYLTTSSNSDAGTNRQRAHYRVFRAAVTSAKQVDAFCASVFAHRKHRTGQLVRNVDAMSNRALEWTFLSFQLPPTFFPHKA